MLGQGGAETSRPEDLEARYGLQKDGYQLSPVQAQEILNMRLHRLTGLEQEKLTREYEDILERVKAENYGLRTMVTEVLTSEIFRSR